GPVTRTLAFGTAKPEAASFTRMSRSTSLTPFQNECLTGSRAIKNQRPRAHSTGKAMSRRKENRNRGRCRFPSWVRLIDPLLGGLDPTVLSPAAIWRRIQRTECVARRRLQNPFFGGKAIGTHSSNYYPRSRVYGTETPGLPWDEAVFRAPPVPFI